MSKHPVRIVLLLSFALLIQISAIATNYFDGRMHTFEYRILGAKCDISTSPVPNLHGGEFSCVWVMVDNENALSKRYAQIGYMKHSSQNTMKIFTEWTDNDGDWHRNFFDDVDSGTHNYSLVQDISDGSWGFYYDFYTTVNVSDETDWVGIRIDFMGEVAPSTSVQMMGDDADESNKTKFSTFRYFWHAAWNTIWPASFQNDGWELDSQSASGYFKIWDASP